MLINYEEPDEKYIIAFLVLISIFIMGFRTMMPEHEFAKETTVFEVRYAPEGATLAGVYLNRVCLL